MKLDLLVSTQPFWTPSQSQNWVQWFPLAKVISCCSQGSEVRKVAQGLSAWHVVLVKVINVSFFISLKKYKKHNYVKMKKKG